MPHQANGQDSLKASEPSARLAAAVSHSGQPATLPSFLHGWRFLSVITSDDAEALAFKASAADAGPTIIYNPAYVTAEDLESPSKAILWLCSALTHISYSVLIECLHTGESTGRFVSRAWGEFRTAVCRHTCMEWDEIIAAAKREGIDFMSEHMAACLFVESGLQDRLVRRVHGEQSLRIA